MKQIIGKRFIANTKGDFGVKQTLTVLKSLNDFMYEVAALDGSKFNISENELFSEYVAVKPTHVITYHRSKVKVAPNQNVDNLIITVAKYDPEETDGVILVFSLFDWLMDVLVLRDGKWYMRERNVKEDFSSEVWPFDSDNSPTFKSNEKKEVYYCYLDSKCGVPAITGLAPRNLIPYLYGEDNNLKSYNDGLSRFNISVQDLVEMNRFNDKIFDDIEIVPNILRYLGYIDVQFYYDKNVKGGEIWSASKFLEYDRRTKWMKDMLVSSSRINTYPGMPFFSLRGVDLKAPVIYKQRIETDDEIKEMREQIAQYNQFLMQYYFVSDGSILLVTYSCQKPMDDSPAFSDEEMAKFMKPKR